MDFTPDIGLHASPSMMLWRAPRSIEAHSDEYESGARIPAPDWNTDDGDGLTETDDVGRDIGVVHLPDDIVLPFYDTKLVEARSASEFVAARESDDTRRAVARIKAYVSNRFSVRGEVSEGSIGFDPPDAPTTTFNPRSKRRLGLHLDSWSQAPIEQRAGVQNRLTINLGLELRSLLFVPVSIAQMLDRYDGTPPANGTDLGREILRRVPDLPIYRLEIPPGHGYVAPTENVIHDGCTLGTSSPGLPLFFHGRFSHRRGPHDG